MTTREIEDLINNDDDPRLAHSRLECQLCVSIALNWDGKAKRFRVAGIGRFQGKWADTDPDIFNHTPVRKQEPKDDDWKPVSDKQALHVVARQKEIEWHRDRLKSLDKMNGDSGTKVRMVRR